MSSGYVHGYDRRESERLHDQAGALVNLLHSGTAYGPNCRVLEAGCGVGAQTVTLARSSPQARIVAVDVSAASVAAARERVEAAGSANVQFIQGDVFDLPFPPASFDHVFVCFLLEHLAQPLEALRALMQVLGPGARSPSSRAITGRPTSIRIALRPPLPSDAWWLCRRWQAATP